MASIATDRNGVIYVADTDNNLIRRIAPDGRVTTIAGTGTPGLRDGPALKSELFSPAGLTVDPRDGSLFIADAENNAIRKLTPDGRLLTLAGARRGGQVDGPARLARFRVPYGVELDSRGRLWIADWGNEAIRLLSPDGQVHTIAGHLPPGHIDGPAALARFHGLMNVCVMPDGSVLVADTDNQRIRVLLP